MTVRIDSSHKVMRALLAALIAVALVVPACMSLACLSAAVPGMGVMGGTGWMGVDHSTDSSLLSFGDCIDAATSPGGFVGIRPQVLDALVALVVYLGVAVMGLALLRANTVQAAVLAPAAAIPPTPLDPRGERLLI